MNRPSPRRSASSSNRGSACPTQFPVFVPTLTTARLPQLSRPRPQPASSASRRPAPRASATSRPAAKASPAPTGLALSTGSGLPVSRRPSSTATAPAAPRVTHVATVSFLAARRAAPSMQFWIALAGGIALARTAALKGLRIGYGASAAAMLQTVAVMGPARVNGPLTQALTAPMLGGAAPAGDARVAADRRVLRDPAGALRRADRGRDLDRARRGRRLRRQLRHAHRLARDPAGGQARRADRDRGAQRRARGLLHGHAGAGVPLGAGVVAGRAGGDRARDRRPGAGPRLQALRPACDHARGRRRVRAAAQRHLVGAAGERGGVAGARVGDLALANQRGARGSGWRSPRCSRASALAAIAARRSRPRRGAAARCPCGAARAGGDVAARGRRAGGPARDVPAHPVAHPRVPPAREASAILDGLDSGGRLIASGRTLVDELGTVELAPRTVAGVVREWVAAEAAGFRAGSGGGAGEALRGPRDASSSRWRACRRWRCSRTARCCAGPRS